MRSGGRQGGGERLAGGWCSPPCIPPSRGGGGHWGPAGALGALRRPAPGPPPGGAAGVWFRDLAVLEAAWT